MSNSFKINNSSVEGTTNMNGYARMSGRIFKVQVPKIATYNDLEIEVTGIPTLNKDGVNYDDYESLTTIMIDVDTMIDYYIQGYTIRVCKDGDIKEIYNIIEDYLNGVGDKNIVSLNSTKGTDDRLEDIDKFASEIFGNNKPRIIKDMVDNTNNGFNLGMNVMKTQSTVSRSNNDVKVNVIPRGRNILNMEKDQVISDNNGKTYFEYQTPELNLDSIKRRRNDKFRRNYKVNRSE